MKSRTNIVPGDRFVATMKKTEHSRTFAGIEKAGMRTEVFIATKVHPSTGWVESGERVFCPQLWKLTKV